MEHVHDVSNCNRILKKIVMELPASGSRTVAIFGIRLHGKNALWTDPPIHVYLVTCTCEHSVNTIAFLQVPRGCYYTFQIFPFIWPTLYKFVCCQCIIRRNFYNYNSNTNYNDFILAVLLYCVDRVPLKVASIMFYREPKNICQVDRIITPNIIIVVVVENKT